MQSPFKPYIQWETPIAFSITFFNILFWGVLFSLPVLTLLAGIIVALGLIVRRIESWPLFETLYWTFITALTVGYGDIRPTQKAARVLSVLIAIIGVMMTGILVAIAVEAASTAFEHHVGVRFLEEGS